MTISLYELHREPNTHFHIQQAMLSYLVYANEKVINQLELIQKSTAWETRGREHITPVLKYLHWLLVSFHIDCKNVSLKHFVVLHQPDMLCYEPGRPLKSSVTSLFVLPKNRKKNFWWGMLSSFYPQSST